MKLKNIFYELYLNTEFFSVFIRSITTLVLFIYHFLKNSILENILEYLYFPNVLITAYNILFTLGQTFCWCIFQGKNYFSLLNLLSSATKIILLTLILWMIFAYFTKLKKYEASMFEYLIIFSISLLFCFIINYNFKIEINKLNKDN